MRWRRLDRKLGLAGFVMAFCDPSRRILPARIFTAAGGPLANLLVAGGLSLVAQRLPTGQLAWALIASFATMNAAVGLANLVPYKGRMGSDGLRIIAMLVTGRTPESHPYVRLVGLSLFGCLAQELPESDLEALEKGVFTMPLVALWYRVKARQNDGDWARAAAMREVLDALLADRDPRELKALEELLDALSLEIEFSRAMSTGSANHLDANPLSPAATWTSPHLWPRCKALRSALAGDRAGCVHWLEESRRFADNAIDDALVASEQALRGRIARLKLVR